MSLIGDVLNGLRRLEARLETLEKYVLAVEQAEEIPADPAPRVVSQKSATTAHAATAKARGRAPGAKTSD